MVHVPLMFLSELREIPSAPCPAGKKNLMTARVSMLFKSCASPDVLPFSLCNKKKTCNSAHEQTPLSNDTIDSVLRHREVAGAKDLSAPLLFVVILSDWKTRKIVWSGLNWLRTEWSDRFGMTVRHFMHILYTAWSVTCLLRDLVSCKRLVNKAIMLVRIAVVLYTVVPDQPDGAFVFIIHAVWRNNTWHCTF